jgi:hypothetical protein
MAFTSFGHHWPSSEGTTYIEKKYFTCMRDTVVIKGFIPLEIKSRLNY